MGESGDLAGHAAQPEARTGVEIGGLEPAVVKAERFLTRYCRYSSPSSWLGEALRPSSGLVGIEPAGEEIARAMAVDKEDAPWNRRAGSSTKRRSQ